MSDENNSEVKENVNIEVFLQGVRDKFAKRVDDYNKRFFQYGEIDQHDLTKEIIRNNSGLHTCMTVLMEERMTLNKIIDKKQLIYSQRYEHYKFNYNMKLDSKYDIDTWVNKDDQYRKINVYYMYQSSLCEHLDVILKSLDKRAWAVKNLTELKKIEVGMS
jgi:hypothetical protein